MKPIHDELQRQQALDKTKSFIVQAPAGSGKTELLTQRFLVLLTCVKQPEEIIAITFTKKSAGEMRARIIQALTIAMNQPEPQAIHAKKTWHLARNVLNHSDSLGWNLLQNPNRLRIQTIDSFNAYITKQLPILSNFGAPPDITDDAIQLYEEAVQEFLSHLEEDVPWADCIAQLLLHLDNDLNKVQNLLVTMLAKRDQWLPYITLNTHNVNLRNTLESNLQGITNEILINLANIFPTELINELLCLLRFSAYQLSKTNSPSNIICCLDLTSLPGTNAKDKKYWLGICELLMTKDFEWRKRIDKNLGFPSPSSTNNAEEKLLYASYKERLIKLINQLNDSQELKITLKNLALAPACHYEENQWKTLQALHQVLCVCVAQLKLIFQQHGKIDYIENAQASLAALGTETEPTNMILALDYQIRHLLIDEFQDTSQSQFRFIEKLTSGWEKDDGRTLFLVGDPMQSIYRFREAEVGLFIRARKNGLGSIKLIPLTLSVNFRSVTGIVNWVNEHFQQIFPTYEDIAMGAVKYSPSIANAVELNNDKVNVYVHATITTDAKHQANSIQQLIIEHKQKNSPESIAVLVRSRSHLLFIINALKEAQIPYRAIDIDPLDTRPVIQDLMALTRALLHPADRIAWLAILRAPWCGLTLDDLFKLGNNHLKWCIWETLGSETVKSLSQDGQIRLARIIPILKQTIANRYRFPLRLWLENCWLALGGPAVVSHKSDLTDSQAYFNLIEKLDANDALGDLNDLSNQVRKLFASPNHLADNSLQIMTIHNSKGLEFDTVILPHLERMAPNDHKQLLLWMERPQANSSALILAPMNAVGYDNDSIYDYIKQQHAIKNDYETVRLLYVAATRAKKNLHLFFSLTHNKNDEISNPPSGSLLEKLMPAIKSKLKYDIVHSKNVDTEDTMKEKSRSFIQRLTLSWQHPITFKEDDPIHYQRKQSGFQLPNQQPKILGTVIHELLQYLCQFGMSWWHNKSNAIKENFIEKRLRQLGMLNGDLLTHIQQTMIAINNTLSHERGLWIIQKHLYAACELRLTATINQKIQSIIIDRTFVDDNDIRWIIDFKTAIPDTQDISTFLEIEKQKYANQLLNYSQVMQKMDHRRIRLGLYFPLIPAWQESIFNPHTIDDVIINIQTELKNT